MIRTFSRFARCHRQALALAAAILTVGAAPAYPFTVSGRFLYEDRLYDGDGYTGAVQNLPIRRAKVEVVDLVTMQTLATGATVNDGTYVLNVTGQVLPLNLFVRCTTDGRFSSPSYEIRVVDNFVRVPSNGLNLTGSQLYSIATNPTLAHNPANNLAAGTYLTQDTDGTGVAQAFNIFDNAVDYFDWLNQPGMLGALPDTSQSIVYAWKWSGTPGNPPPAFGSNYSQRGVFIGASPAEDTDAWSDTVILHETGHWLDDVFFQSDNPGGAHFIGDNDADVLLAYGEGAATYHCGKVRQWRAANHVNLVGAPIDNLVSLYADLVLPPAVGTPGGLSFSYDFETGNFADDGTPIGQTGSANETNVTSALWDLVDAADTPDFSPGVDDDPLSVSHPTTWDIERNYIHTLPAAEALTVEDYYQGWFVRNGTGFQQSELDAIFVTLAGMPFYADGFEPDNAIEQARPVTPLLHELLAGHVVVNEIELGATDAVELYNGTASPVDLTGWQIQVYANATDPPAATPPQIYTFQPMSIGAGDVVVLHEGGAATDNGTIHVYGGDRQVFNASWNPGVDGAVVLRNGLGQAVDFVKWRGIDSLGATYDNATPVPAGVAFTGTLDTPLAPQTMARNLGGADSDQASDFSPHFGSLGAANHPSPESHTVFDVGDQDVFSFQAVAGARYGFEATGPFSASDPRIELLSASGAVLGMNDDADLSVRDARLDFYASTSGTYYLRVTHAGSETDWAQYSLMAFQRPIAETTTGPSGMTATAENSSDAADPVDLQWVNAGAYDSVAIYRDGTLVAELAGTPASYVDHAARGLHRYEIAGIVSGTETSRASDYEFAGLVSCSASDDFESGNASQWMREGSTWDVTPIAQAGTFGFTDSPAGTYEGCADPALGCDVPINAIAEFGIPAHLVYYDTVVRWDQICITEHCEPTPCDVCIVEVSNNAGASWIELARFDQASDPAWGDNVADPTDWRPAQVSLAPYVGQEVRVRFRLQSDPLLELDGWYVDNVRVSDPDCLLLAVGDPIASGVLEFLPPAPNPVRRATRLSWALPRAESRVDLAIYDVSGRLVRLQRMGAQPAGIHSWSWDARDSRGEALAAGTYFARLLAGPRSQTRKVVLLGP